MSDREGKLRELAVRGATEGERRAALEQLERLRSTEATRVRPGELGTRRGPGASGVVAYQGGKAARQFYPSYDVPDDPRCFCCGRREREMSEWAAWQGTHLGGLPLSERRLLCADCEGDSELEKRPCTDCGRVERIGFSCADAELCFPCWRADIDRRRGDDGDGGGDLPPGDPPPSVGEGQNPSIRVAASKRSPTRARR